MSTTGKTAASAQSPVLGDGANNTGDLLYIDTVQPAWPQSKPVLLVGGTDRLLVQEGFLTVGTTASEAV